MKDVKLTFNRYGGLRQYIPRMWWVNGIGSALGSTLAIALAISYGFSYAMSR